MILKGQNIRQLNTITHDSKVVAFGTAVDGQVYYSVKRLGFEDSALQQGVDPFGFEDWQLLRLGDSLEDASVIADDKKNLSDKNGTAIIRTVYGNSDELRRTAQGSVQLVSARDFIWVFRQALSGKILVSRFVLDGMTNQLVPKLEVRYRRSRQRLEPQKSIMTNGQNFDTLDFRDIDGQAFYEGSYELTFAGTVANGWFAPVFVPTLEADRFRWQIFVYDATAKKLVLYTVGSSPTRPFDVRDYVFAKPDAIDDGSIVRHLVPGILKRTIDPVGWVIAGCPTATTYDVQKEQATDAGTQLLREATRLMLAFPATKTGSTESNTAVIDFALATDGTLSQLDATIDESTILRHRPQAVIPPITLLNDIEEMGQGAPPEAGSITATLRDAASLLQVRNALALPGSIDAGTNIKVRDTKSFDGPYKVLSVDGTTFEVAAQFDNNAVGAWEVVPNKETSLVFDNMIVGTERTAAGNLKVLCAAHDLKVGDDVQISGTEKYDGVFAVNAVDATNQSFTLDTPFFTGKAGNLSRVVHRGLIMDGNDRVVTPDLELTMPRPDRNMARTLSAWVYVEGKRSLEQSIVKDDGEIMNLVLGSDNKVKVVVLMSDNKTRTVADTAEIPINTWVHLSASLEYSGATTGQTRIILSRNGVVVNSQSIMSGAPGQFGTKTLKLDGAGDYIDVPAFANPTQAITVSAWVRSDTPTWGNHDGLVSKRDAFLLSGTTGSRLVNFYINCPGAVWPRAANAPDDIQTWHYYTGTFDGHLLRMYVDGQLRSQISIQGALMPDTDILRIGGDDGFPRFLNGQIMGVEVWDRALTAPEIQTNMAKRLTGNESGLVGYWPLDDGTVNDLSSAQRNGTIAGNPTWVQGAGANFLCPQTVVKLNPPHLREHLIAFDGIDDRVEVLQKPAGNLSNKSFTVELWMKRSRAGRTEILLHQGQDGINYGLHLLFRADDKFGFAFYYDDLDTPVGYTDQNWHHWACTFDVSTRARKIYRDGELVCQDISKANYLGTGNFNFGCRPDGASPFEGGLADIRIWTVVRSQAQIKDSMYKKLTGTENNLIAYWPLDLDQQDRSPNGMHGKLVGNPAFMKKDSIHTIGKSFIGEIADVQIWNRAQPADEVRATMNLALSGKEQGLSVYYPMGAIVDEPSGPIVPDFAAFGRNGRVYGDPFVAGRRLNRATKSGAKVVKYGCEEVVAVQQRGTYEELFEFHMTAPGGFDPNNADGKGGKLFTFSYWGKSSRASNVHIPVPADSVTQDDFQSIGGGWYKAVCRVTIPDGMSVMRAFEVANVNGIWGAETTAPPGEWTVMDIRRHEIKLISDSVTKVSYTDTPTLAVISGLAQSVTDKLAAVANAETKVARLEADVQDLNARIEVSQNSQTYQNELTALEPLAQQVAGQKNAATQALAEMINNRLSYYHQFQAQNTGEHAHWVETRAMECKAASNVDNQRFRLAKITEFANLWADYAQWNATAWERSKDAYYILPKTDEKLVVTAQSKLNVFLTGKEMVAPWPSAPQSMIDAGLQIWHFANDDVTIPGTIQNGLLGVWHYECIGRYVVNADLRGTSSQSWKVIKTNELTAEAKARIDKKKAEIASLSAEFDKMKARIDWLKDALSGVDSVTTLQTKLATAKSNLTIAQADLTAMNNAFLAGLVPAPPASMSVLATDVRELATNGAVLDFVQSTGAIRLFESAEGNVLLTCFDRRGRIRATPYDAVADSRNATFEQWIPEGVRACPDFRNNGSMANLAKAVTLPEMGWTCDAWFQYPVPMKADGKPYDMNVLASSTNGMDAPIVIRDGYQLSLLADGCFYDSGIDLRKTLAHGWHHVAVTTQGGECAFYLDGVEVCRRIARQSMLRCNGTSDWLEVPAHANPVDAVTVSVWARSNTAIWNANGCLVSKRKAFIMHPMGGTREIKFYVFTNGNWESVNFTPPEIERFHCYTGTFDGRNISLYIDGQLVQRRVLDTAGTIAKDKGVMMIGRDDGNNSLFAGKIGDVAIWDVARNAREVLEDMDRVLNGTEEHLFGYWRMDPTTIENGATIKDLTKEARHGVIHGTPVVTMFTATRAMDIEIIGNVGDTGSPIGRLANVRFWDGSLSSAEVEAHARAVGSGYEPGLIAYLPLDEAKGTTVSDRAAEGAAQANLIDVTWAGCTADFGNPGSRVLSVNGGTNDYVTCPNVPLANRSFSIEFWARRTSITGTVQGVISMGTNPLIAGLNVAFMAGDALHFGFVGDGMNTTAKFKDSEWHHYCVTYDKPSKKRTVYADGQLVGQDTAAGDFSDTGSLIIGRTGWNGSFIGDIADVRIWNAARTGDEVRANMYCRLSGTEGGLLAYYPLDGAEDRQVMNAKTWAFQGKLGGHIAVLMSTSLPIAGGTGLLAAEYSTVGTAPDMRTKRALMRRCFGFVSGGTALLVADGRLEELAMQWVGNAQIRPSLLGYIEGPPPVPSENLTRLEDYCNATSVTLTRSEDTTYSWQRSSSVGEGFHTDVSIGASWESAAGLGVLTKLTEGSIGVDGSYDLEKNWGKDSSVSAGSILTAKDSLSLGGGLEDGLACPAVGKRWMPKNVGYALVVAGMADVFVTRLKRSGRMVGLDVRPVEGVPLDVNTITFMMNPAYAMNGSLDGQVGSAPADPTFFGNVPAMRAQYGSLYPASYMRIAEAYTLKAQIEREDKERETFFYNFDAKNLDELSGGDSTWIMSSTTETAGNTEATSADKQALQSEAEKRRVEIQKQQKELEQQTRSGAAFAEWQQRMENILHKAGKRNIVNSYVWDADGGFHSEEQGFTDTVEHSVNADIGHSGSGGAKGEVMLFGFKFGTSLVGSGRKLDSSGRTISRTKALQLEVDVSGVEGVDVTDLRDNPALPGEKVDRYRFMTFYLDGSTDHFHHFFSEVVDPEWLLSNSEEARALRQAQTDRPNKPWRVMHRVTYLDRPMLKVTGRELRGYDGAVVGMSGLRGFQTLSARIDSLEAKLDRILAKING